MVAGGKLYRSGFLVVICFSRVAEFLETFKTMKLSNNRVQVGKDGIVISSY